jgi:WD40 repeat protein
MRSFTGFWIVVCGLAGMTTLAGCVGPQTELPPTGAPSEVVVLVRRSATPSPTQAGSSSPAATPTPVQPEPVRLLTPIGISSNTLDVESAAHLIEAAHWGMGIPLEMVWSPGCGGHTDASGEGQCWLALATTSGIYRFAFNPSSSLYLQDVYEPGLPVASLAWSPGCGLTAEAECWLAAGYENGGLTIWDANGSLGDEPAAVLQNGGLPLRSLAWSPGCADTEALCRLAAGTWDGTIYLWDIEGETLSVRELWSDGGSIDKLIFNSDSGALLSWSPGEMIKAWDVAAGIVEDTAIGGAVAALAYSHDGTTAALTGSGGGLRVHDTRNGYTLYALTPAEIDMHNLTLAGDGSLMAVQEGDVVRLRTATDGRAVLSLKLPEGAPPDRLALTADGSWLAAAGPGTLWVWQTAATQLSAELRAGRALDHLALSADGSLLATWRETAAEVELRRLDDGSAVNTLSDMPLPPLAVVFSQGCSQPEDCLLAAAADALRVWDVSTGRQLYELHAEAPGAEHRLTFYDPASGQTSVTTLRGETPLASAAFSSDGSLIAAGGFDGTVRLWTLAEGQAAAVLPFSEVTAGSEDARVVRVVFSSDDRLIAGLGSGGSGVIWDAGTGALLGQFSLALSDEAAIEDVCYFAFQGENLAVGWEGQTTLIDSASAELLESRNGWCGLPLALTPDGMIAAGGGLLQLEGPGETFARRVAVAAAPQGGRVVIGFSGSGGSLAQVWDLANLETPLLQSSAFPFIMEDTLLLALAGHDGGALSLADADGRLWQFRLPAGELSEAALELPFKTNDRAACFAFSQDGSLAAAGSYQGAVVLWSGLFAENETPAVRTLRTGSVGGSPAAAAAFSPGCGSAATDACQLAAAFGNGELLLWTLDGADPLRIESPERPLDLDFAPDGSLLAVATEAGVHVLRLSDGVWVRSFPGYAAQFSPTGDLVVVDGGPGRRSHITVYNAEAGTLIKTWDASGGTLALSPDGQLLAVSGLAVDLWDLNAAAPVLLNSLPNFAPYGRITFSDDGAFLILASWDGTVHIWGAP